MKQKIYSNWSLATTYYLTSAFATNVSLAILSALSLKGLPIGRLRISAFWSLTASAIFIAAVWLGTLFSAKWIGKYIIKDKNDKNKVVNLATSYAVVVSILYSFIPVSLIRRNILIELLRLFVIVDIHNLPAVNLANQVIQWLFGVAPVLLFFFLFSKAYVKNTQQP